MVHFIATENSLHAGDPGPPSRNPLNSTHHLRYNDKSPQRSAAAAAAQAVNPGTWSEINGALKSRTEQMFLHLQGFSQLLDATFPEPLLGN